MVERSKWYENYNNLLALGWHLHREYRLGVPSILYFFEKPWKFEEDWLDYRIEELSKKLEESDNQGEKEELEFEMEKLRTRLEEMGCTESNP